MLEFEVGVDTVDRGETQQDLWFEDDDQMSWEAQDEAEREYQDRLSGITSQLHQDKAARHLAYQRAYDFLVDPKHKLLTGSLFTSDSEAKLYGDVGQCGACLVGSFWAGTDLGEENIGGLPDSEVYDELDFYPELVFATKEAYDDVPEELVDEVTDRPWRTGVVSWVNDYRINGSKEKALSILGRAIELSA